MYFKMCFWEEGHQCVSYVWKLAGCLSVKLKLGCGRREGSLHLKFMCDTKVEEFENKGITSPVVVEVIKNNDNTICK